MALSADTSAFSYAEQAAGSGGYIVDAPVASGVTIYKGSLIGHTTTGYMKVMATGRQFYGVALEGATGGSSNGSVTVKTQVGGVQRRAVTSGVVGSVGKACYCSDDNTLTMVATAHMEVGRVVHFESTAVCWVEMKMPGWGVDGAQTAAAQ